MAGSMCLLCLHVLLEEVAILETEGLCGLRAPMPSGALLLTSHAVCHGVCVTHRVGRVPWSSPGPFFISLSLLFLVSQNSVVLSQHAHLFVLPMFLPVPCFQ